jgi:hypothetical protein
MDSNKITICIPRVELEYNSDKILEILKKTSLGSVKKIDIVPNHKEKKEFNRVFIHFSNMYSDFHKNLLHEGKTIKIIYNYPWFWKCSLSFYN